MSQRPGSSSINHYDRFNQNASMVYIKQKQDSVILEPHDSGRDIDGIGRSVQFVISKKLSVIKNRSEHMYIIFQCHALQSFRPLSMRSESYVAIS